MHKLLRSITVTAVLVPAALTAVGTANAATYEQQAGKASYQASPSRNLAHDGDADYTRDVNVVGPNGSTISHTGSSIGSKGIGRLGGLLNLGALLG